MFHCLHDTTKVEVERNLVEMGAKRRQTAEHRNPSHPNPGPEANGTPFILPCKETNRANRTPWSD